MPIVMETGSVKESANTGKPVTNKKLLLIEKTLFIIAVVIAEFYMMLAFTDIEWIADKNILLFIAPPFAVAGILVRRKRKKEAKNAA